MRALGIAFHCDSIVNSADAMPIGIGSIHRLLGVNGIKCVVCPKCHSVYSFDDYITRCGSGELKSKHC